MKSPDELGWDADEWQTLMHAMETETFPGVTERGFSYNRIRPLAFCVSFAVLFPRVIRVNDGYFLRWVSEDAVRGWTDKGHAIEQVEAILNRVHIWDFFQHNAGGQTAGDVDLLCQAAVKKAWSVWLPLAAHESVVVEASDEPESYGPSVTFYIRR